MSEVLVSALLARLEEIEKREMDNDRDLDDEEVADAVERMRAADMALRLADPAGDLADRIVDLANVVRGEGQLAARPGQMARLEKAADQLVALADEVRLGTGSR
jgi:hypothetical protein